MSGAPCECRWCRAVDRYHQEESRAAARERAAVRLRAYDVARVESDRRTRLLLAAGRALERCEGGRAEL